MDGFLGGKGGAVVERRDGRGGGIGQLSGSAVGSEGMGSEGSCSTTCRDGIGGGVGRRGVVKDGDETGKFVLGDRFGRGGAVGATAKVDVELEAEGMAGTFLTSPSSFCPPT